MSRIVRTDSVQEILKTWNWYENQPLFHLTLHSSYLPPNKTVHKDCAICSSIYIYIKTTEIDRKGENVKGTKTEREGRREWNEEKQESCGRLPCLPCWQTGRQVCKDLTTLSPPAGPTSLSPPLWMRLQLGPNLISTVATSQHRVLAQLLASHKVELPPFSEPLGRFHGPSQIPKFLACPSPFEETKMPCFFHA